MTHALLSEGKEKVISCCMKEGSHGLESKGLHRMKNDVTFSRSQSVLTAFSFRNAAEEVVQALIDCE